MAIGVTFTTTQVICWDAYEGGYIEDETQAGGDTEDTLGDTTYTEESVGGDGYTEDP